MNGGEGGQDGPREDHSSFLPGLESSISTACLAWATELQLGIR